MTAHRLQPSAMRSNDNIDWPVHPLMLSFHDLRDLPLRRLPSTVPRSMILGSVAYPDDRHGRTMITCDACRLTVKAPDVRLSFALSRRLWAFLYFIRKRNSKFNQITNRLFSNDCHCRCFPPRNALEEIAGKQFVVLQNALPIRPLRANRKGKLVDWNVNSNSAPNVDKVRQRWAAHCRERRSHLGLSFMRTDLSAYAAPVLELLCPIILSIV